MATTDQFQTGDQMRSVSEIRQQLVDKQEMLDAQEDPTEEVEQLTAKQYVHRARMITRNLESMAKARAHGKQKIQFKHDSAEQPVESGRTSETEPDDDGHVQGTVSDTESTVSGAVSLDERPKRRNSFRSETNSK